MLNKLPATATERGGGGVEAWVGESLIRGGNADETYLARPRVHEAPRLPVQKHQLAERLLRLSFG